MVKLYRVLAILSAIGLKHQSNKGQNLHLQKFKLRFSQATVNHFEH